MRRDSGDRRWTTGRGRLRRGAVAAALAVAVLVLPPPGPTTSAQAAGIPRGSLERGLVDRINEVRRARGLRPLRPSGALARAARAHVRSMARGRYFGHASQDGTSVAARIARFYGRNGSRRFGVGEALLLGPPGVGAAEVVRAWLRSPPHRRILLGGRFRQVGIAALRVRSAPAAGGGPATLVVADFGFRH